MKEACPEKLLVDLKTLCGMSPFHIPKVQCSNVVYLSVVDMHADTPEAMKIVISKLYREYKIGESGEYLVLAGDQKAYPFHW